MLTRLTDPFTSLTRLQDMLDALSGTDWFGAGTGGAGTYPPVNIFQEGDHFILVAEMPGVKKSDLRIQVQGEQLRIAGLKPAVYGEGVSVHRRERLSGEFDRTVTFPFAIDEEGIKAEYRDGMLAIYVPRSPAEQPRLVNVD